MKHLLTILLTILGALLFLIYKYLRSWSDYIYQVDYLYQDTWCNITFIAILCLVIWIGYGKNLRKKSLVLILFTVFIYLTDKEMLSYFYFKKEGILEFVYSRHVFKTFPLIFLLGISILTLLIIISRGKRMRSV